MSGGVPWWTPPERRWTPTVGTAAVAAAVGSLLLAWVSTWATVEPYGAPALWLPLGWAIGLLLRITERRVWFAALAGLAFGTFVVALFQAATSPGVALAFAVVNLAEALAVVAIVRRAGADRMERPRDVFVLAGAILPVAVVAGLLVFPGVPAPDGLPGSTIVLFLALSDTAAVVTLVPAIIGISRRSALPRRPWWERLAYDLSVVLVVLAVFVLPPRDQDYHALLFLPFPVLTWFAVRRGLRATAGMVPPVVVLTATLSVHAWGAAAVPGLGEIGGDDDIASASVLNVFVAVLSMLLYAVALLVEQRERYVAELRRSAELLRALSEGSGAVMYAKTYLPDDRWGTYVWVNQQFFGDAGERGVDVLGRRDDELFTPDRAERFRQRDEQVLALGAATTTEESGPPSDTDPRTFLSTSFPVQLTDEDGVRTVVGIATDITARRHREDALATSERLVWAMFDRSPLATLRVLDPGSGHTARVVAANPAVGALLRAPVAELIGVDPLEYIHPDDRERFVLLARSVRGGDVSSAHNSDLRMRRPDGGELLVEATIAPILSEPHRSGDPVEFVIHLEDVTDQRLSDRMTTARARRDAVTGLLNRHTIVDLIEREVVALRVRGGTVTVLYVDLDDFKRVNDVGGHAHGDRVLRQVGESIIAAVRPGDAVGRIGGDEFVVVCPRLEGAATDIAERLRASLAGPGLAEVDRCPASVGGVVVADPDLSVAEILRRADWAMYRAKAAGRDRVAWFDHHEEIAVAARSARVSGEVAGLLAYYQPIVALADGQVVGLEAYARVPTADGTVETPTRLIEVARAAGVVGPLDDRMLSICTAHATGWRAAGRRWGLTVNVSPDWLGRPGAVERVLELAAATALPPTALTIDVPVDAAVPPEPTVAAMVRLRSAGIHVAADHVTGDPVSISRLAELPFDRYKCAPAVAAASVTDGPSRSLLADLVRTGARLDIPVAAEGVESELVAAACQSLGVTWAQGYHWAAPQPLSELLTRSQVTSR